MSESRGALNRVLVANRGEIAVRVIRACRELGIAAVAVYGEGEERAVHVRAADDAYRLAPSADGPTLPYLDIAAMLAAARQAGADAVHPGYGFLAENAGFAAACTDAGLIFVGPPAAAIEAMGDKVAARRIAAAAGVPVVPGTADPVESVVAARAWADEHGYPVAVKAAGGGGGRGFRVARDGEEIEAAFTGAAGEAKRSFANPAVYLERYLERPRHVEIQVFADAHGSVVSLGERDCSIQRRHQKLIEETPSPAVDATTRAALDEAAVALARAVDYRGAGTVEFLLTPKSEFFFLEMNTRIQVEHTVTELVTGIDLVKEQLLVAMGEPLSFLVEDARPRGHAIQCRINAEDAGRDFAPAPGTVSDYREPGGFGIRVDSAMESGAAILPAYDSLIAKLAVWGRTRDEAIARTRRALAEFVVTGVPTTIPFHLAALDHPAFRAGSATTAFLSEHPEVIPAATGVAATETTAGEPAREVLLEVAGRRLTVRVLGEVGGSRGEGPASRRPIRSASRSARSPGIGSPNGDELVLISPLQGTVVRVGVTVGETVTRGHLICVVEAMKMENELVAHRDGVVKGLHVAAGDSIGIGGAVAEIE